MTTAINLATPDNADQVISLMGRFHAEVGKAFDDGHRAEVAAPLLAGNPLGAIWLIGPTRAPLGYVTVTFGWSMEHGGMIGWLEEIFIRESVRSRGIGTEVLHAVVVNLRHAGLKAMHVQLSPENRATSFCKRCGFTPVDGFVQMTERF